LYVADASRVQPKSAAASPPFVGATAAEASHLFSSTPYRFYRSRKKSRGENGIANGNMDRAGLLAAYLLADISTFLSEL